MKKGVLTCIIAALAFSLLLVSCASTPKERRALKWDAEKIYDVKKARTFAENYDMDVIEDIVTVNDERAYYAAKNVAGEAVVFYTLKQKNMEHIYVYVNANGNKTSIYKQVRPEITFYMRNTDKEMKYDGAGYYVKSSDVEWITKMCCEHRESIRNVINGRYKNKIKLKEDFAVQVSDFK